MTTCLDRYIVTVMLQTIVKVRWIMAEMVILEGRESWVVKVWDCTLLTLSGHLRVFGAPVCQRTYIRLE